MKTPRAFFRAFLLLTLLVAAGGLTNRAHAQYQSFFGHDTTEYAIQGFGCSYVTEYDPEYLYGNTSEYLLRKRDTVNINNHYYYKIWQESIYLREDTIMGRIFRYDPFFAEEVLICDLSLSVGDTFWMPFDKQHSYNGEEYGRPVPIIADTIMYINGLKHIQFRTIYEDYDELGGPIIPWPALFAEGVHHHPILFIEGIGPNFSPFGWLNNMAEGCDGSWLTGDNITHFGYGHNNPFLLCVHKDRELAFMSDERAGCSQMNGASIKDKQKILFNIYPNPTRNILNIEFENMPKRKGVLYITDMVGRVVWSQETPERHLKINVKRFQSGLYVVTWIGVGKKHSVKFVKK